jgi:2-polyprenyl-3-methyl-5-hydroxy-6-metoxy-1,4-benzoquinol methylase
MEIAIFGAGRDGMRALQNIGKENIRFFIDNYKAGNMVEGIPVVSLQQIQEERRELLIFVASEKYKDEIINQLEDNHYTNYCIYEDGHISRNNHRRLSREQWGDMYNESSFDHVMSHLEKNCFSVQTQEIIKLTGRGEKVLEIGCGTGESSLALAKEGRLVSAIDYSPQSIHLVSRLAEKIGCEVSTYCIDAFGELPFQDQEFDVVFQAGLLEHFEKEQRIEMLSKWKRVCKKMVSMVPNAHSLAYRTGKQLMEKKGTWIWGMELPQSSLSSEFEQAGYVDIKEYSIGARKALDFLPENHYLRTAIGCWLDEAEDIEDWGQGYLLVTTANNPGSCEETYF